MSAPDSLPIVAGGEHAGSAAIRRRALELFDAVGIAAVSPLEAGRHYERWLSLGRHGAMDYLASQRHRERRADVERVLPGARAVICVALCHEPGGNAERDRRLGRIARY